MSLVHACLLQQRRDRPEVGWLAAPDYAGTGRTVLIPILPAVNPGFYDGWPWSALAGFRRSPRELRAILVGPDLAGAIPSGEMH